MSELFQSGHHPDADQLNAFVEHALPAHEHQETLAHLAICSDCRAIVVLSMPPLEETLPQPEPVRRPWFAGSRLLWPVAAAATLALLVATGIHIRKLPPARPVDGIDPVAPQVAVNHPPPAAIPQPAESKQAATVAPPHQLDTAQPAPAPIAAKPVEQKSIGALRIQGRSTAAQQTAPASSTSATGAAVGSFSANGANIAMDQVAAASPTPGSQPPASNALATIPAPVPPLVASGEASAVTNASAFVLRSTPVLSGVAVPDIAQAILRIHPLPSGLPALSIVTNARHSQTLAVDIHGALFLTADSGEHWTPVAPQWLGRAVKVALADSGSSHGVGFLGLATMKRSSQFAPPADSIGGPVRISSGAVPSSLSGIVTDTSGAIIPGATVIVSSSPAQLARMAKTDATGHYVVDGLVPGNYSVQADCPGFIRQQLSGVAVVPGKPVVANLSLQIGALAETITVTAAAQQVAPPAPLAKMKIPSPAPQIASQPVFEITTDTNGRWVSADGLIWKRK